MWFYVQLFALFFLCLYMGTWSISTKVEGRIQGMELGDAVVNMENPAALLVEYEAKGKTYLEQFPRDNIPFTQKSIRIRYLTFAPSITRIDSFEDVWLLPIMVYALWLFVTSLLLLTNNVVFSKHTVFETFNHRPWISMHEYFPYVDSDEEDEPYFRFKFHKRPKKPTVRKIRK